MADKERTFSELRAHIQELQRQADALRAQEVKAFITEVRARVAEYGLSVQDVFPSKRGRPAKSDRVVDRARLTGVARRFNPESGKT